MLPLPSIECSVMALGLGGVGGRLADWAAPSRGDLPTGGVPAPPSPMGWAGFGWAEWVACQGLNGLAPRGRGIPLDPVEGLVLNRLTWGGLAVEEGWGTQPPFHGSWAAT